MKNIWITRAFFLISLSVLFVLNFHNVLSFPETRGLDATAHIEYIQFLQTEKRIPLPFEGWQLYQTPLYYLVVSFLPNLKLVQIFGIITWLIIVISTYYYFKSKIATLLIASLPVIICQIPAISNELFSAAMITLSMAYYLKVFLPKPRFKQKMIFGIILGLTLLSKATAVLLIPSILIERFYANKFSVSLTFMQLINSAAIAVIISAWFYLRNLMLFKNPFAASPDFPKWADFGQETIPRNLYFFSNLKGFINLDFFRSQDYSFLSGTYFSFFYDAHNIIIPPQVLPTMGVILFLLSVPISLLILKGIYLVMKTRFRLNSPAGESAAVFFTTYCLLIGMGYIAYNFKLPYYSTVKGSFLTSLSLPVVYFFIQAIRKYNQKQKLGVLIYLSFYALIITKHFWVQGWWY